MTDEVHDSRDQLIREVRQRLESLRRAGLDRIPVAASLAGSALRRLRLGPSSRRSPRPGPSLLGAGPLTRPSGTRSRGEGPGHAGSRPVRPAPSAPRLAPVSSLFGEPEIETPPVPVAERPAQLLALAEEVAGCERCPHLAAARTRTVFGEGSATARLMFVGEAPGADEDRTGRPFVGRAGVLLTDMITKGMGLDRADVYIANVLKSRPPENRDPLPEEIAHCLPFLERQIAIIRPEFLCLLGKVAASTLLETALPMGRLRGKWHRYRGIPAVVTYHPSYLLRNPAAKKDAWGDLQMLMQAMGLKPPARREG